MTSADIIVAGCSQVLTCAGGLPKRGPALKDVGVIENGWVAGRRGVIVFTGDEAGFKAGVRPEPDARWVDGRGLVALPGFVDAHTHLPFAGDRSGEFKLRLEGRTYRELAEAGLGIQSTVKATRAATRDELVGLCLERLDRMLITGTTTVEAKSGYGLNLEDELKQLEAVREARRLHPVDIIPTYMGAHEVPPEYREDREGYLKLVTEKVMPEVRRRNLAEFFDVFCEAGVFSAEETRRLLQAAKKAGFGLKIHADEFAGLGGAELAAEVGAVSAEHLISASEEGVARLAASDTAALLLPGVSFSLRLGRYAQARRLADAGAVVALATDFNPGSSMVSSMLFILQLGVYQLGLGVEEAVNACTANAAFAVRRHQEVGSLEPGKKMDVILCDVPDYISLAYHLGPNHVRHVIKAGRVVIEDGAPAQ